MTAFQILEERINPAHFSAIVVPGTHYVQLPEERLEVELAKVKEVLIELGFEGMFVDLAYINGEGVRDPEKHPKTEVYFMLSLTKLTLDGKTKTVNEGDVVVIRAGVMHQPQNPDAQYLMANIRQERPDGVASRRI